MDSPEVRKSPVVGAFEH